MDTPDGTRRDNAEGMAVADGIDIDIDPDPEAVELPAIRSRMLVKTVVK